MSVRLSELVLECIDPPALAKFWCAVLDYVELDRDADSVEIGPAAGFGGPAPTLIFSRNARTKTMPLRLHWDLNPVDSEQDTELARLLALGARPADVGQSGHEDWHVLQDPEGNEFCLLRRTLPLLPA